MTSTDKQSAYFLTIIAGISIGTIPIISAFLRDRDFFTLEQMMLRLFFGAIISSGIIIFFLFKKNESFASFRFNVQIGYFLQGFILCYQIYVYFGAIVIGTPVGEVALLVQIHPIVTLLIGWLFLNELITKEKGLAVALAIIGVIILAQPWTWTNLFSHWLGDLLALFNGFFYGLYIVFGRKFHPIRKNIPSMVSISWVLIWTFINSIILLILVNLLPLPEPFKIFRLEKIITGESVIIGVIFALLGSFIPYSLIMLTSRVVESSKASILLLGEAISAIILGYIFLNESITLNYILGGFVLFLAIIIIADPFRIYNNKKILKSQICLE
ncbi:MAG: DMT family transporter [Candidatus Hodarchaeales archaeon]